MSFIERLPQRLVATVQKQSLVGMTRVACWIALVALAVMVSSVVYPMPLLIIFATSVGQLIGIVAFLCYLLSILMDIMRGADHAPEAPGPARKFSASNDDSSPDAS